MKELFEKYFSIIEDERCECDVKHKLKDVLELKKNQKLLYDEIKLFIDCCIFFFIRGNGNSLNNEKIEIVLR